MSTPEDCTCPPLEITSPIPEGCIPVRAIEIVVFLNPDGNEEVGVRWQGTANIVSELGMLEYAKHVMALERGMGEQT